MMVAWMIPLATIVSAQTAPLTAEDAVALGRQSPAIVALRDARKREAEGMAAAEGRWANPEIAISREQVDVPGGEATDQFYWLRQRIDISGSRRLEQRAGAAHRDAAHALQSERDRHRDRLIRQAFHDVLAAEQRYRSLAHWREGTRALRDDIAARVANGDAARFDLLRLERELASVAARVSNAEAESHEHRTRLFSMLAGNERPLAGELLPATDQPLAFDPAQHPHIQALEHASNKAQLTAEAARRERWPQVTLGVGQVRSEDPGFSDDGPLLALEFEVPLFQRGKPELAIATAEMDVAQSERAIMLAKLQAEYAASAHAFTAQREAAMRLAAGSDDALLAMAQAAYKAGEINVAELLDAYQAHAEAALLEIDLKLATRRNWIELQYLTGE